VKGGGVEQVTAGRETLPDLIDITSPISSVLLPLLAGLSFEITELGSLAGD
jgi:hypothetical protein